MSHLQTVYNIIATVKFLFIHCTNTTNSICLRDTVLLASFNLLLGIDLLGMAGIQIKLVKLSLTEYRSYLCQVRSVQLL
jgi:hypothetical protein